MDTPDILVRSAKGEDEIANRTYQLQLKQRSVLIMIDGRTSEAELLSKISVMDGGGKILRGLEEQGFIERKPLVKKSLFDSTAINGMELRSRFVRSAVLESLCDGRGRPTSQLEEHFRALANGMVGLIITGGASVLGTDGIPGSIGIYADSFAPEMKAISRTVHDGGGKVCVQLVHRGVAADRTHDSAVTDVSLRAVEDMLAAFRESASRAKEWTFDAVQIHAGHGHLINRFLSPLSNRRTDAYGGSVEKRTRLLLEVYRGVRTAVGPNYPVLVKLNGSDFVPNGLTIEDAVYAASAIEAEGADAIEVSSGTPASGDEMPARRKIERLDQEAYNLPLAEKIKAAVKCPVIVADGLRSFDVVNDIVQKGKADYVSLGRPFNREPLLVKRWREGDISRARCISCNECAKPGTGKSGIACVREKIERTNRGWSL